MSEEMHGKKRVWGLRKKEAEERAVFEGVDSGWVKLVRPESV